MNKGLCEVPRRLRGLGMTVALLGLTSPLPAQEAVGDRIIVSAERLPEPASRNPFALQEIGAEDLRRVPQLRLDDILRAQVPGFSLFRRSSSRVAHPTTQGVTLRNFGPSGAGRTLVLLDGIPLNDPFAGYVSWHQLPPALIDNILVTPGGGAGLFGNAALAGTIFVSSRRDTETTALGEALLGDRETYGLSAAGSLVEQFVSASLFAESFSTGGYPVLQRDQRGEVDRDASSESEILQLAALWNVTRRSSLELRARGFYEDRNNGTHYTRNDSRGEDVSAAWTTRFPEADAELRLTAHSQRRRFRSTFSAVNAARDFETPALDQFHVPAIAAGGSAVWSMALGTQHRLTIGADTRWVEGETNERFRFVAGDFTRRRNAGGEQFFLGVFAEDTWQIAPATSLAGGLRLDYWRLSEGRRNEFDLATGAPTFLSSFADRDGFTLNGRLGGNARLTSGIALRAAFYTGFRVPTLNELYRPFRVGNIVTEANAELEPERLFGGEAGIEWRPLAALRINGTFFYNRLEDAIGNVTLGPGLRQRRNLERVTAPGVELSASWQLAESFFLRASYLFTQPTDPDGRLLAQTPGHVVNGALEWRPDAKWLLSAQARYSGRQFEDDQNAIALAPFLVVDAAVHYDLSQDFSAGLKVENVFNREVETGKSPEGLVSIGGPRLVTLQLQYRL